MTTNPPQIPGIDTIVENPKVPINSNIAVNTDGNLERMTAQSARLTQLNSTPVTADVRIVKVIRYDSSENLETRGYGARVGKQDAKNYIQILGIPSTDSTYLCIPRPADYNDARLSIQPRFDVPPELAEKITEGLTCRVRYYRSSIDTPFFSCLSGDAEPEGIVEAIYDGAGIVWPSQPGGTRANNSQEGQPAPCLDQNLRQGDKLRRPTITKVVNGTEYVLTGGRLSPVTPACAEAWGKQSFDLPTLRYNRDGGVFPMDPVSKKTAQGTADGEELVFNLKPGSDYGPRVSPASKKPSFHSGIDYNTGNTGVNFGTNPPLYACLDGKIFTSGLQEGWGKFLIITHGPYYDLINRLGDRVSGYTLFTVYAHLNTITKTRGFVKRGEQIALANNTGRSTGPHLHFEVGVAKPGQFKSINKTPRTDPVVFFNSIFHPNGKWNKKKGKT